MDNRKKNILLGLLIVGIISMTIAFAALTTRLSLNGTANVAATSWNIHFDSWTSVTQSTVDNHQNTAEINESQITQTTAPNITKIDNVNVTLNQPGDYIKYNFVIVNDGSIDGKLSNFTKTVTPTNDVVGLTVNCYESSSREGTPLTTNYVLRAGETIYCYFEVKYNDATNTSTAGSNQVYTQSAINASISANWTWIQDDTVSAATSGGNEQGDPDDPLSNLSLGQYYETTGAISNTLNLSWDIYISGQLENAQVYVLYYEGSDSGYSFQSESECIQFVNDNDMSSMLEDGSLVCKKFSKQKNASEVCGKFSGGTVCINPTGINCATLEGNAGYQCFEENQYVQSKAAEMESKGATCTNNGADFKCIDNSAEIVCQFSSATDSSGKQAVFSCDKIEVNSSASYTILKTCSISPAVGVSACM